MLYVSDMKRKMRQKGDGEDKRMRNGGKGMYLISFSLCYVECLKHLLCSKCKLLCLFMWWRTHHITHLQAEQGRCWHALCDMILIHHCVNKQEIPFQCWCCLWFEDCIWSAHETLSLSICYWSFSFLAILTADLKPFHPEPFNGAEYHRHGQSDNM